MNNVWGFDYGLRNYKYSPYKISIPPFSNTGLNFNVDFSKGFEVGNNVNEKSYLLFEVTMKGVDPSLYSSSEIFDPYVQVEKNSKKFMLQSLLLGSSKKYINKLKGEIWVNNQYANQVSFAFILPIEKHY